MSNLYKRYYEAMNSGDEWSAVRASEIREEIESKEYIDSWDGGDYQPPELEGGI